MRQPKPAFSWDHLEAVRRECGLAEDDCPAHAITTAQYMERFNLGRFAAERELQRLVAIGKMKTGRRLMPAADGRRTLIKCYWPA